MIQKLLVIYDSEEVYGGENSIIIPSFINAHTRVAIALFRGIPGDVSGFAWPHRVWEAEKQLTYDDVYAGVLLRIGHTGKSGIATFAAHHFSEAIVEAAGHIGVKV